VVGADVEFVVGFEREKKGVSVSFIVSVSARD